MRVRAPGQLTYCDIPRACVNPAHMEPVTIRTNALRATVDSPVVTAALKTHCKYGHEFTPENTARGSKGERRCRTCARRYCREAAARRTA